MYSNYHRNDAYPGEYYVEEEFPNKNYEIEYDNESVLYIEEDVDERDLGSVYENKQEVENWILKGKKVSKIEYVYDEENLEIPAERHVYYDSDSESIVSYDYSERDGPTQHYPIHQDLPLEYYPPIQRDSPIHYDYVDNHDPLPYQDDLTYHDYPDHHDHAVNQDDLIQRYPPIQYDYTDNRDSPDHNDYPIQVDHTHPSAYAHYVKSSIARDADSPPKRYNMTSQKVYDMQDHPPTSHVVEERYQHYKGQRKKEPKRYSIESEKSDKSVKPNLENEYILPKVRINNFNRNYRTRGNIKPTSNLPPPPIPPQSSRQPTRHLPPSRPPPVPPLPPKLLKEMQSKIQTSKKDKKVFINVDEKPKTIKDLCDSFKNSIPVPLPDYDENPRAIYVPLPDY